MTKTSRKTTSSKAQREMEAALAEINESGMPDIVTAEPSVTPDIGVEDHWNTTGVVPVATGEQASEYSLIPVSGNSSETIALNMSMSTILQRKPMETYFSFDGAIQSQSTLKVHKQRSNVFDLIKSINESMNELNKLIPGSEKNQGATLQRALSFISRLKHQDTSTVGLRCTRPVRFRTPEATAAAETHVLQRSAAANLPVRPDHPLDILSSPSLLRPNRRLPTLEETEDPFSRAKPTQSSEAGHIITADRRNQIDKSMATALQKRYDDEMEVYALFMGALKAPANMSTARRRLHW
ncbi:hypothetical protein MY4038_009781 [Beauveria bassiana]